MGSLAQHPEIENKRWKFVHTTDTSTSMKRKVVHLSDDQIAAVKRCSAVFSLPLPEAIEEGKLYVEEFQFYTEVEYSEEMVKAFTPECIQHMKTIQEEIDSKSRNKNKHQ